MDNITKKVIKVYIVGKVQYQGWIFLWRFLMQKHPKPPIAEKRRNKAKYLTWTSIRLKFLKKTSIPNSVKSLGYIKCYNWSSPDLLKAVSILSHTTVRRSAVDWKDQTILEIRKRPHFSRWSTILLFTSFSKTLLTTERRLTGQYVLAIDLSSTFLNTETTD